jgi:hypothetical protein
MFGLSSLYVKLIGGLVAALILAGLLADRGRWMHRAHNAEATNAAYCIDARQAANNPKLDCKQTGQQIIELGRTIGTLTTALHKQSDAVAAMGAETVRQQKAAEDARKAAEKRAGAAQSTVERLSASARAPERQSKPCEPSKALVGAWR